MVIKRIGILLGLLLFVCVGCSPQKKPQVQADPGTLIVATKAETKTLYFDSRVKPLEAFPITAKADGTIVKKYFKYGTVIAKDQLLFVINSPQLLSEYQDALTQYLKGLKDLNENRQRWQGAEQLKENGIISDQEYRTTKNQFFFSELSLAQNTRKLKTVLQKLDVPFTRLEQLNVDNPKEVGDLFENISGTLKIFAPMEGIALAAEKSGSSNNDSGSSNLTVGSQVKAGQGLVTIGNQDGISFDIKVSEIDIDDVEIGQEAKITGDGFPGITLKGVLTYKERQPAADESSGMPSYRAYIVVPKLTEAEKALIRNGMSARVALQIKLPPMIYVPLTAVFTDEDGQTMVKRVDKKTKKIVAMPVQTGATTPDSVEIREGLMPGDEVMIAATKT